MSTPLHSLTRQQLIDQNELSYQRERAYENVIAEQKQTIAAGNAEIIEHKATIAHQKYQLDDLRRLIFQSKSERFISKVCPTQYALEFAVDTDMVAAAVDEARIKIAFERKKTGKKHWAVRWISPNISR